MNGENPDRPLMERESKQTTDPNDSGTIKIASKAPEQIRQKHINRSKQNGLLLGGFTERREMEAHRVEERSATDNGKQEKEFASSPWKTDNGGPS